MSNEKQETVADIVKELREIKGGQHTNGGLSFERWRARCQFADDYADRIEAAAKREREAGAAAAQVCGEIGEMIGRESARRSDGEKRGREMKQPIERLDYEALCRRWYYRNAVMAFKRIMERFSRDKSKDKLVYLMAMIDAALRDPEIARYLIEFDGDGLRFRNHERHPKTGKLIRCECYLN